MEDEVQPAAASAAEVAAIVAACPSASLSRPTSVVSEGETVMLVLNDGFQVFVVAKTAEFVKLKKGGFPASLLLGVEYGTVFELTPRKTIEIVESGELMPAIAVDALPGADNRDLVDTNTSQTLTSDDIAAMRAAGHAGEKIISALVENSATFASKTAFSQEKYIRKKQLKYLTRFRVLRPTAMSICNSLLLKDADKMCGLRSDSLAQLLTAANIHVGGRVLVMDGVGGVLVGAVAERMGTAGTIIVATEANHVLSPAWAHLQKFNIGQNFGGLKEEDKLKIFTVGMQSLVDWSTAEGRRAEPDAREAVGSKRKRVPEFSTDPSAPDSKRSAIESMVPVEGAHHPELGHLENISPPELVPSEPVLPVRAPPHKGARNEASVHMVKPLRLSDAQKQHQLLLGVDSVIIACSYKPTLLLLAALRYARPSAPYAVFCAEEHALAETYRQVKSLGLAINNDLHETWYRPYQVLPGRTHPMMTMHGASGYLLNGIVVETDYTIPSKQLDATADGATGS